MCGETQGGAELYNPPVALWPGRLQGGAVHEIGNSLFLCEPFQALSAGAQHLYLCMALECGGRRQYTFPAKSMTKYGIPLRSSRRYVDELIENGFISCIESGRNTRTESKYEFRLDWKNQ